MSETQEAIDKAQSRAQGAAKSDTDYDEDHGDLHQTAQKVSKENSAQHGSDMKQAEDNKQSETGGTARDQVQGVESSSSWKKTHIECGFHIPVRVDHPMDVQRWALIHFGNHAAAVACFGISSSTFFFPSSYSTVKPFMASKTSLHVASYCWIPRQYVNIWIFFPGMFPPVHQLFVNGNNV